MIANKGRHDSKMTILKEPSASIWNTVERSRISRDHKLSQTNICIKGMGVDDESPDLAQLLQSLSKKRAQKVCKIAFPPLYP